MAFKKKAMKNETAQPAPAPPQKPPPKDWSGFNAGLVMAADLIERMVAGPRGKNLAISIRLLRK